MKLKLMIEVSQEVHSPLVKCPPRDIETNRGQFSIQVWVLTLAYAASNVLTLFPPRVAEGVQPCRDLQG